MATFSIVMLVCADLTRSRDFYRELLGLPVRQDLPKRPVRFELGNGAVLSLHRKSDVLAVRPGSLQLGFVVDERRSVRRRLRRARRPDLSRSV